MEQMKVCDGCTGRIWPIYRRSHECDARKVPLRETCPHLPESAPRLAAGLATRAVASGDASRSKSQL